MTLLRSARRLTVSLLALLACGGPPPSSAEDTTSTLSVWSLTRLVPTDRPKVEERGPRVPPWSREETERRVKAAKEDPHHIQMPMRKVKATPSKPAPRGLGRRWAQNYPRSYKGWYYLADLVLGSPGQTIPVMIDTGSFELFVNPSCNRTIKPAPICAQWPAYNSSKSISYSVTTKRFTIVYAAGPVQGYYVFDDIGFGGYKAQRMMFGVADSSNGLDTAVLGLSFGYPLNTNYATVLDRFVTEKFIKQPIFSISLGSLDELQSQIILGGVDLSMFSGPLVQLPIEPAVSSQAENYKQYMVHLTDIGITVPNGTELTAWYIADVSFSEYVMVDSGATLNFLPDQIINRTLKAMGGTRTANGYFVDCKWLSRPGSFDLYFKDDGFEISVPWKDFLLQEGDLCKLGVAPAIPGVAPLLGVTFMRGAYLVFDQVNQAMWMAKYNRCSDEKGHKYVDIANAKTDLAKISGIC